MISSTASKLAIRVLQQSTTKLSFAVPPTARSFVSATRPLLEQRKCQVPTMGDSITEGTIVEWTAQVGQAVKEGDVVALVETDKVTVDIKAEIDGVITAQFAAIDDTIDVGADMYEIDTDAEATVEASADSSASSSAAPSPAVETPSTPEPTPEQPVTVAKAASPSQHRQPSIKFLGKDGWRQRLLGAPPVNTAPIPPNYGRPVFTEEEMEALMLGGANLAPDVKQHSGGASFGY